MSHTLDQLGITTDAIRRYDRRIPRYTSYPAAPYWTEEFDGRRFAAHLERHSAEAAPLALYVHLPFCEERCLFCGCNVIVTRKKEISQPYLELLEREIALIRKLYRGSGRTLQLHLGGGTPNYLTHEQMDFLLGCLRREFDFLPEAELSIEVDPRLALPSDIETFYRQHGFRRISFGVQDFHEQTQHAIGREQTEAITFANVSAARAAGFKSVNIDLIYGLPLQTEESWRRTLERVRELRPDRIALYNFAYLPSKMKQQKRLNEAELPTPELKLQLFIEAHNRLTAAGWEFIGMDHYALAEDSLARALREHTLRRNFMGYNTLRGTDMLAFGVSSISQIQGAFAQNVKKLPPHRRLIEEGLPPVERGLMLSEDDLLRQFIIEELMCGGRLRFGTDAPRGAAIARIIGAEQSRLDELEADGLLMRSAEQLDVTRKGRMFLRNIAVVFDAYERARGAQHLFSRAV